MNSLKHPIIQTTRFVKPGIVIGLAIAFTASAFPSMAQPVLSHDQIKQRIENDYGVTVLRIKKITPSISPPRCGTTRPA